MLKLMQNYQNKYKIKCKNKLRTHFVRIRGDFKLDKLYDVIIIGSGVVGNAIAREMSRYNLKIGVLEKELDVCNETSSKKFRGTSCWI